MLDPLTTPPSAHDEASDPDTLAVVEVLAMLHGRIEGMLTGGATASEVQLPDLTGRMMHGVAEAWKSVGKRAFGEAERHIAEVAVDAILAVVACRRALRLPAS